MWKIKDVEIDSPFVLSPMAGISDAAYMKIVEEMGVGYVVTELISSEAIVRNNKKTFDMLNGVEDLSIPYAIQLFGADSIVMAQAAKIVSSKYPGAIIDLNFGCPVPKVAVKAGAGSGLLKTPQKIYEIVRAVVNAVDVPVTVKIRSGWDERSINAVEVAKLCASAGASAIAIHARTRSQGYSGSADWNIIKEVVNAVSIPVIGNGDVKSASLAKKMLDETGCTAVMIGRSAFGNPWIFREASEFLKYGEIKSKVTYKDKIDMIKKHFNLLCKYKSEKEALLEIRSHAMAYLKGMPDNASIKNQICMAKSSNEILGIIDDYYKKVSLL